MGRIQKTSAKLAHSADMVRVFFMLIDLCVLNLIFFNHISTAYMCSFPVFGFSFSHFFILSFFFSTFATEIFVKG